MWNGVEGAEVGQRMLLEIPAEHFVKIKIQTQNLKVGFTIH